MGFLDINLMALAKTEPELAQRLKGVRDNPRVRVSEDGDMTVSTENGTSALYPGFKASGKVPKLSGYGHLKDSDVVIVFGFGTGAHVKELIQATSPKTFILVIDPFPDLFRHALKLNDLSGLLSADRLSISVGEDPLQATRVRLEKYFGVFTLKSIKLFQYPQAVRLAGDYFARVEACIKEISHVAERNRDTMVRFSEIWRSHILGNLPQILKSPGVSRLTGKFSGRPAAIISAGPSLDKNAKWLKAAMGRVALICVDTALKTLLKNGITPDFLICLDAMEANYRHVAEEKTDHICLVANPVTFPQILKNHKGKTFMMTFNDPLMVWIEKSIGEKGSVVTGGSVATAAFDFARQLGASPILLVGQDLAFTDHRAYTSDSFFCEMWRDQHGMDRNFEDFQNLRIDQEPTMLKRDVHGRDTLTTAKMFSWKKWFETMISREGVKCVHATEGGLEIAGAVPQTLREAIWNSRNEELPVGRVIEEIDFQPDQASVPDLLKRMKGLAKKVERIERTCSDGVSLAIRLLIMIRKRGPDKNRIQNGMARLGSIASNVLAEEEFLEINKWSVDVLIDNMQGYKSESRDGPIQTSLASYQMLLGGIRNICKGLGGKLNESIARLK